MLLSCLLTLLSHFVAKVLSRPITFLNLFVKLLNNAPKFLILLSCALLCPTAMLGDNCILTALLEYLYAPMNIVLGYCDCFIRVFHKKIYC